ncbi:Bestrophin-like protein [Leptotrombidium deliense]|uniref:Bestrophin homolog n=1 Tax=Leptotrombidium deliense TaxID=299467 RepID=A0A443SDV2_9ACAR|nr:Bestrophin-like protein [Leptotrombidium deliense]
MYIPGSDETSRILRRTLMRYLNLSLVLVLRSISDPVKRRFPTHEHLVDAGFMTKHELDLYMSVPSNDFNTFWIPCSWFVNLLREARQECRINDSSGLKLIMEVVTIATYAFFIASVFGRQQLEPSINTPKIFIGTPEHRGEFYIPFFTILQFLLYMGLLKLGEQLINPFGDDDEDFELNWLIDRHIKVSFLGVDVLNRKPPPLTKDIYFDKLDIKVPYTPGALSQKKNFRGSMVRYR